MSKLKKGIAAVSIATAGATGTIVYDQAKPREYVRWAMTEQGPKVVDEFSSNKMQVNSLTNNAAFNVEENILYHTTEYDPSLLQKVIVAATNFLTSCQAPPINPIPAPGPTPTPQPIPTPAPTPAPPIGDVEDWGFTRVRGNEANAQVPAGQILVAVIDTGIDKTHPDVSSVKDMDFTGAGVNDQVMGHGTHCAGIIAAHWNGFGSKGLAGKSVGIMAIRVLDAQGSGSMSAIAQGMNYAGNNGARVMSLSLGSTSDSSLLQATVKFWSSKGVQIFMANGNDSGPVGSPARYADQVNSFAISATNQGDAIATFSSRGPQTSYAAPGVNIFSTVPTGCQICDANRPNKQYSLMSGTSMATPYAAAACALHLLAGFKNCSDLSVGYTGGLLTHGKGRIDALLSVTK